MTFHFAWVAAGTPFDAVTHAVEDEEVFAFEIAHDEGDFPSALIDVKNPRIGLLNAGREVWAWLAESDASTDGAAPLFFGRLIGMPEQLQDEVVRLAFTARPSDFDDQKRALAATLRVLPYYDPLWIEEDRRDDPDAVLEGYARLWHIDRLSHVVTASDVLAGEDGTLEIAGDFFRDSLDVTYGPAPVRRVRVRGEASWTQAARGSVNLSPLILKRFKAAGSGWDYLITSYTGEGLMGDWPEEGDRIGGGWEVGTSRVVRVDGRVGDQENGTAVLITGGTAAIPLYRMVPTFHVRYDVQRRYAEIVEFDLEADCQAIITEPGDEEVILLTVSSADADKPIDALGAMPIGDLRSRTYFNQSRGRQSLENLICLARARLLMRSRAVLVTFQTRFENGLDLSLRKNATIADARLPGGTATGKIIGYRLRMAGDTGERVCEITIGCTVGQGNTVAVVDGTPTYVEEGYVGTGYQVYTGQTIMPIAGEVTYEDFSGQAPSDDGRDFFRMTPASVVQSLLVINGENVQQAVINGGFSDAEGAAAALNQVYTEIDLTLHPVNGGPYETTYQVTVSDLMVPKTINLEAAAV